MFRLNPAVKAKVRNVEVLSHKNREPDANPGAKISLTIKAPNTQIALINPALMAFWEKGKGPKAPQGELEGTQITEAQNLTQLGAHVPSVPWAEDLTGYTLTRVFGTGDKRSNQVLKDCTLTGWKIAPHEGGTGTVKFIVECNDVGGNGMWDALAKLKGTEIEILLEPPVVAQQELDAAPANEKKAPPRGKEKPQPDATELHLQHHGAGKQAAAH